MGIATKMTPIPLSVVGERTQFGCDLVTEYRLMPTSQEAPSLSQSSLAECTGLAVGRHLCNCKLGSRHLWFERASSPRIPCILLDAHHDTTMLGRYPHWRCSVPTLLCLHFSSVLWRDRSFSFALCLFIRVWIFGTEDAPYERFGQHMA